MVRKSPHPEQLFQYLNSALDSEAARMIAAHLYTCDECASVAAVVRALKESALEPESERQSQISNLKSQISEGHPDVSELASFFYSRSRRKDNSRVAAHVALCRSCAEEIAQYARADSAAYEYNATESADAQVRAKAWEMINDWEGSGFAKLKPASEVLGQELLTRLSRYLDEQRGRDEASSKPELVPVTIVSSSGKVRSVEFFERAVDSTGGSILKHSEGSARFDDKPVHVLLDFGKKERIVMSDLIRSGTIRLKQPAGKEQPRRADYFIIED